VPGPSSQIASGNDVASLAQPQQGDMKLKYHPSSGRKTRALSATDYCVYEFDHKIVHDDHPWHPFRTRADFEAAELALRTSMNKEETETLFNLINRTTSDRDVFTLNTYKDAVNMWDLASSKQTGVSCKLS
jgi:hypothetical protein